VKTFDDSWGSGNEVMRSPAASFSSVVAYLFSALIFPKAWRPQRTARHRSETGVWAQNIQRSKARGGYPLRHAGKRHALRDHAQRHATRPDVLRLFIGAGSLQERRTSAVWRTFLSTWRSKAARTCRKMRWSDSATQRSCVRARHKRFTSYDETVFKRIFRSRMPTGSNTGLLLLREIGGELLLTHVCHGFRAGVVLSEERFARARRVELAKSTQAFQFEGQLAARRDPIRSYRGNQNGSGVANPRLLSGQYRPENATLVAVGDFDVDAMEAKIKARFADWRGKGTAGRGALCSGLLKGGARQFNIFVS